MNSGEKIYGEFVIACGEGSNMIAFVEATCDEVALEIERRIKLRLVLRLGDGGISGVIPRWASLLMIVA